MCSRPRKVNSNTAYLCGNRKPTMEPHQTTAHRPSLVTSQDACLRVPRGEHSEQPDELLRRNGKYRCYTDVDQSDLSTDMRFKDPQHLSAPQHQYLRWRDRELLSSLSCVLWCAAGVLFSRISGAEVEMRVRPGDSVTLYCDCVWKVGFNIVWFRNCSHHHQPPLMISATDLANGALPRYSTVWNPSTQTHDLVVRNVSESDLGLYYCALHEKMITRDSGGVILSEDVYHYGNRTTRLSVLGKTPLFLLLVLVRPPPPSRPPPPLLYQTVVSAGSCWSVCVLCVFSSPQSSPPPVCTGSAETGLKVSFFNVQRISGEEVEIRVRPGGVLFSRISGAEVEMRVRPRENVVLYCDCVWKRDINLVWFRKSSNEDQPPLVISAETLIQSSLSRLAFVWNYSNQTNDLLVKNVSESDLGLYYCAVQQIKFIKDGTGAEVWRDVYRYGNRTTRLSLLGKFTHSEVTDTTPPPDQTPSTPPVSDCSVCWKLLVSVCLVWVLLSSTCVYCIYRNRTKGEKKDSEGQSENQENQKRTKCSEGGGADGGADGVVYAPVNITSRGQNRQKKNRVERSDICTYSEVVYGVLFSRISGEDVEMSVRPGDNVVLYSDCVLKAGVTVWFRNGSNEDQTALRISGDDLKQGACSHYAFVWNHYNQTQDLLVKNVTESDLGLYYCAHLDPEIIGGRLTDVYYYGNRTSRLSLLDTTPSTPPVSDCSVCWKLLVSVCPVWVLLSSTCVYCMYRNRTKGEKKDTKGQSENQENQKTTKCSERGGADGGADGVVYAPVNITSRGQNCQKKNRVERSDICTYSEVKHGQRISGEEVEMRVRPGDNVILYSDCTLKIGVTVWFRNSSNFSPLVITIDGVLEGAYSRHGMYDLLVKNVTESELGLYYCAQQERKPINTPLFLVLISPSPPPPLPPWRNTPPSRPPPPLLYQTVEPAGSC
ncbi:hypothetical protein NFI96_029006 [Prochilodus magdalenae]|nr:hypothetical protein NFI96_029006 [Prochilodus magdalenae]